MHCKNNSFCEKLGSQGWVGLIFRSIDEECMHGHVSQFAKSQMRFPLYQVISIIVGVLETSL